MKYSRSWSVWKLFLFSVNGKWLLTIIWQENLTGGYISNIQGYTKESVANSIVIETFHIIVEKY